MYMGQLGHGQGAEALRMPVSHNVYKDARQLKGTAQWVCKTSVGLHVWSVSQAHPVHDWEGAAGSGHTTKGRLAKMESRRAKVRQYRGTKQAGRNGSRTRGDCGTGSTCSTHSTDRGWSPPCCVLHSTQHTFTHTTHAPCAVGLDSSREPKGVDDMMPLTLACCLSTSTPAATTSRSIRT